MTSSCLELPKTPLQCDFDLEVSAKTEQKWVNRTKSPNSTPASPSLSMKLKLTLFRANASVLPTVRSGLGVCLREQPLPLPLSAVLTGAHLENTNQQTGGIWDDLNENDIQECFQGWKIEHAPPHCLHPLLVRRLSPVHSAC